MERGYLFITMMAPAAREDVVFQTFVANSEEGGERLRAKIGAWKDRNGFAVLRTGFSTTERPGGEADGSGG
jgi:hypothetical protein